MAERANASIGSRLAVVSKDSLERQMLSDQICFTSAATQVFGTIPNFGDPIPAMLHAAGARSLRPGTAASSSRV